MNNESKRIQYLQSELERFRTAKNNHSEFLKELEKKMKRFLFRFGSQEKKYVRSQITEKKEQIKKCDEWINYYRNLINNLN